ncbi:unnamed protein product [Ilex paraguariensis]|uniref:Uncharacterized protein n=1 Tax=Ilex paraguariensis TaxID=185542 RepID=A0ABC8STK3_9AQUA
MLEQNKQYIQEPPTVHKCNMLPKQLLYTRLASIPGRCESFWKEVDYAKHVWKNRQELKVKDAGIAALFGPKCFAWYCAATEVAPNRTTILACIVIFMVITTILLFSMSKSTMSPGKEGKSRKTQKEEEDRGDEPIMECFVRLFFGHPHSTIA